MSDLGRIERTGGRRALAHDFILGRGFRRRSVPLVTFAGLARAAFGEGEPPEPEAERDQRCENAKARRRERRRAEERHGDGVLDRRRPRQHRHGESRGAERDRRRHQPLRHFGGAKQRMRHRREHEEGDEQADAAIGDQRAGENHRQHGPLGPEPLGHEGRDRRHRAGVLHQLAEQRAEQKDREELHDELGGARHERLRPVREHRLPRQPRGDDRGRGREQKNAPAAIGEPDEETERDEDA